jgi:hypothetical protein
MAEVLRQLVIKDVFANQQVVTIKPDDTINHAFQVRVSVFSRYAVVSCD